MTSVFTRKASQQQPPATSYPPLPPGALVGCQDDLALCVITNAKPTPDADYRGHPRKVSGSAGVVAADQSRCSDIGAAVLKEGGHAVDAAVAVTLCQGVVNPFASGVGGGHFNLVRLANGSAEFIDAREQAPGAASFDMYRGKGSRASWLGGLAIAVPLELKGLELAWRKYGRMPWRRLVMPAAEIARHGFAAHPYFVYLASAPGILAQLKANNLTAQAYLVRDYNTTAGASAGWRAPRVGELCCKRPALADTLTQIANKGVAWLYAPERLQLISAEIQKAGGIITSDDFQAATPMSVAPMTDRIGDMEFTFAPPPSSGSVVMLALKIMAGYNQSLAEMGPELAAHRMIEAMKHVFAVRTALGDPGNATMPFTDVEGVLAEMADPAFIDSLRASINDSSVLPPASYGGHYNPLARGEGLTPDDHGTSHLAVLDKDGNAVSLTTTVNGAFGSYVMSAKTGILWNNEMDDFSQPDRKGSFNLTDSAANYIQPWKRPLSSMSPIMVTKGGKLRMVVGASNGKRIVTGIIQTMLRILYEDRDPLVAVSEGRLHQQWDPNVVLYENYTAGAVPIKVDPTIVKSLADKGNTMLSYGDQLGDVQVIMVDPDTGLATAACDPRKDGAPAAA